MIWLAATRPRTLAAGAVPVAVGTALASTCVAIDAWAAVACLVGAILIQIGCNFANDAFDALQGADTPDRLGPRRAVAAGLITPRAMLGAAMLVLGLAFAVGLFLSSRGGWPIFVLGVVSLVCAIAYTGGPFPLAYRGLGDVFVFLFFGLAAVLGSAFVQLVPPAGSLATAAGVLASPVFLLIAAAVGMQATAIIAVNNLRDIPTDARVGKRTLAVRIGARVTRWYIAGLHVVAVAALAGAACVPLPTLGTDQLQPGRALLWLPAGLAGLGGALLTWRVARCSGSALNPVLGLTAALELLTGLAIAGVLAFG